MIKIKKVTPKDLEILQRIGASTFVQSHEHSCSKEDLEVYIKKTYHPEVVLQELNDPNNIFHLIYYNGSPAGYSKIIPNVSVANNATKNVTKLERIYILNQFYDKKLGLALMQFNIELSKKLNQKGMWLYVWMENHRAVNFYKKSGFKIIGEYDFRISETHTNPNYQMLLNY